MLKYALLGLLVKGSLHGYNLKNDIERVLGGNWDINFGQIYTTLARLERDRFVKVVSKSKDGRGKKTYAITKKGRYALNKWLSEPVKKPRQLRDEFFIKLIVGKLAGVGGSASRIDNQRQSYLQQLRYLIALASRTKDIMVSLLIEGAIQHLQADLNWLDVCSEKMKIAPPKTKKHEKNSYKTED